MNTRDFEAQLIAENFGEIVTVEKPVGYTMDEHQHPFEAWALITHGALTLQVAGVSTTYAAGDVFRLPAGTPHCESAISYGATYLAGRKQPLTSAQA